MKSIYVDYKKLKRIINLSVDIDKNETYMFLLFGRYERVYIYKFNKLTSFKFIKNNNGLISTLLVSLNYKRKKVNSTEYFMDATKTIGILCVPLSENLTNLKSSCDSVNDKNLNRDITIDFSLLKRIIKEWKNLNNNLTKEI